MPSALDNWDRYDTDDGSEASDYQDYLDTRHGDAECLPEEFRAAAELEDAHREARREDWRRTFEARIEANNRAWFEAEEERKKAALTVPKSYKRKVFYDSEGNKI